MASIAGFRVGSTELYLRECGSGERWWGECVSVRDRSSDVPGGPEECVLHSESRPSGGARVVGRSDEESHAQCSRVSSV